MASRNVLRGGEAPVPIPTPPGYTVPSQRLPKAFLALLFIAGACAANQLIVALRRVSGVIYIIHCPSGGCCIYLHPHPAVLGPITRGAWSRLAPALSA